MVLVRVRQVVRGSGWSLAEVESLSLEGEGIRSLHGSLGGLRRLVYLNLARNKLSSLLVSVGRLRVADTHTHTRRRVNHFAKRPSVWRGIRRMPPPARLRRLARCAGVRRSYGRAGR